MTSRVGSRTPSRSSSRTSSTDGSRDYVTTTPFAAKYPTQFTPPCSLSPAISPSNLDGLDEESALDTNAKLTYQVTFCNRKIMVASLTPRERRILQSELETYNMQLISLQIGTAPLSCYARPEERNMLYSIAYKTTFPAKFSMSITKDEDEGDLSKEEIITLFTAKWDAADAMMCLGYGMLPLTTQILTE